MKHFKKLGSVLLALAMVLALAAPGFAATISNPGSNTISVEGAKNGEKYDIYRMLDLSVATNEDGTDVTGYRYTFNTVWEDFWTNGAGKDYIDIGNSAAGTAGGRYVTWKSGMENAASMEAFAAAAAAYAKANNIAPDAAQVTAENGKAEWTGLVNGYYLLTSTYGTQASVASTPTSSNQTVKEKNNDSTTEKEVQENVEREDKTQNGYSDTNDAQIGDTITFRAKVSIAKNAVNVIYHDTMDEALTFSGIGSVKVYTDENLSTELDTANYTVAAGTGGETFQVAFDNAYVASLTGATTDVWVYYTAILNDKATVETGVKNTAKLTWGENGESTESETETKTHKFEILKYAGNDTEKKPLAGAEFQLYTQATGGTPLTLAKNAAGTVYRVVANEDALPQDYTIAPDSKIVTVAGSTITVEGVDSDSYWLEEVKAPDGYNGLTARQQVIVNKENSVVAEVINNTGTELPSTGGIGTTIFYIVGGVLVVGAVVLLIAKRRTSVDE